MPRVPIEKMTLGVGARFGKHNSVTVAVHCYAHALDLCFKILEDSFHAFGDTLEIVK